MAILNFFIFLLSGKVPKLLFWVRAAGIFSNKRHTVEFDDNDCPRARWRPPISRSTAGLEAITSLLKLYMSNNEIQVQTSTRKQRERPRQIYMKTERDRGQDRDQRHRGTNWQRYMKTKRHRLWYIKTMRDRDASKNTWRQWEKQRHKHCDT